MKKKIKFDLARYEQGNCEVIDEIGDKVRIFATDFKGNDEQLIIGAVTLNYNFEAVILWHRDGTGVARNDKHNLCLLVEECPFSPFDRVLVRNDDTHKWECELFRRYKKDCSFPYECIGNNRSYSQCIPYEGNETLADTTKFPKNK